MDISYFLQISVTTLRNGSWYSLFMDISSYFCLFSKFEYEQMGAKESFLNEAGSKKTWKEPCRTTISKFMN